MPPKKLIIIDASSLNNAGCLRKFWLSNLGGLRSPEPMSVQMEYGSAFHIFKQIYKQHGNADLAIACGLNYFMTTPMTIPKGKDWMNRSHFHETCLEYLKQPPEKFQSLMHDGKPLVEQTVSIPYLTTPTHEILLAGTMDDLGEIPGGCYLIKDTKTTGTWNHREFFSGYGMSHQLMLYRFMVEWLGERKPDSIYGRMASSRIGCAIDGVFLAQGKTTTFETSPVEFYSTQRMREFKTILDRFIARIIDAVEMPLPEGILTQTCMGRFDSGKCEYFKACAACDDVSRDAILRTMFVSKPYNPMNFRSLTPEIESMIKNYVSRNNKTIT